VRVAAAQAASVWLDSAATAAKVVELLERAARERVELVVFPETFLSGYPFWVMLGGAGRFGDAEHARAYGAYLEAAVELDGPELRRIAEAARDLGVFVFLGVTERGTGSGRGTVYCTLVAIDPQRGLVGAHRKLNPTHAERTVWGRGDGNGLRTHRVGALRVGGLNCWENWMPLARHALYADGEEVHVAAWPGSAAQTADIARFRAGGARVRGVGERVNLGGDGPGGVPVSSADPRQAGGVLQRRLVHRRPGRHLARRARDRRRTVARCRRRSGPRRHGSA
jgi:nitrilase